jgi:hypothetical protein
MEPHLVGLKDVSMVGKSDCKLVD